MILLKEFIGRTCDKLANTYDLRPNKVFEPIDNDSLVNRIIDSIIQAIVDGKFKVGDKLPSEYELINELNVGRNSLREAMKILSALGVVTIKRGDGTYVCSQVSPRAFDSTIYSIIFMAAVNEEILELRKIMDTQILKLVIKRASDDDIAKLRTHLPTIREAYERGDTRQTAYLDNQFHVAVANLSKNAYLTRIVEGVYKIFSMSIENRNSTKEAFRETEISHEKLLDCLEKRDYDMIESVVNLSLFAWENTNRTENN